MDSERTLPQSLLLAVVSLCLHVCLHCSRCVHCVHLLLPQISEDKFRKVLLGLKLGYSDENTATLVRHYDFDHVGEVYYREFCKDVRYGYCYQ